MKKAVLRSPGAGATWNDLEPWLHFQAKAGTMQKGLHSRGRKRGQDAASQHQKQRGVGREPGCSSSLFLHHWLPSSGSVRASRKIVPRDASPGLSMVQNRSELKQTKKPACAV